MAYSDNYPNGYKSGYSSADDPERRNYSPSGVEAQQRDALAGSYERERRMSAYQAGLDKEQRARERREAELAREKFKMEEIEREGREQVAERRKAINTMVQQKRDAYNRKSWLGRTVAALKGKSFNQNYNKIVQDATKKVDRMTEEQIERYNEKHSSGGRGR